MILAKLYLSPLGAFSRKLLEFTPGMNVVLGPNEAGKSTLFNAARLVLLVSTDLGKRDRERLIGPYLPVTGGDFVRVAVEFHKGGEVFKLTRRWGNDPSSKLDLPGAVPSRKRAGSGRSSPSSFRPGPAPWSTCS